MQNQKKLTEHAPGFKGYSIDELRYQMAYTQAKLEIQRERMATTGRSIYGGTPGKVSGIMGKMLSGLNYVDYAVIAFRFARRIYGLFHRSR